MIITRTPVRISIGGGGTDLPSFYSKFGSKFTSAAINKYIYIVVQERKYHKEFLLKYSKIEKVKKVNEIKNEIIREALKLTNIKTPLEVIPISDVGGQTGLGSSGAFTVGLLNALHAYKQEVVNPQQLAKEACHIAIDVLKQPSGKQDEYISAFGGLTSFKITKSGRVRVYKSLFDQVFTEELEHLLYMFYTGMTRKSKNILKIQKVATENNDKEVVQNLKEVQRLGNEIQKSLVDKNVRRFGELMHEHWLLKKKRAKTSNKKVDRWYRLALNSGAIGGKIMGAGGGGFFLFYCDKNAPILINKLQKAGLQYIPFNFDHQGSKVMADL